MTSPTEKHLERARKIVSSHTKYRHLCNGLLIESIAHALAITEEETRADERENIATMVENITTVQGPVGLCMLIAAKIRRKGGENGD